jgi:hypothetical protein
VAVRPSQKARTQRASVTIERSTIHTTNHLNNVRSDRNERWLDVRRKKKGGSVKAMAKRSTINPLLEKVRQLAKAKLLLFRARRTEGGGKARKGTTNKRRFSPSPPVNKVRGIPMVGYAPGTYGYNPGSGTRTTQGLGQLGYLLSDSKGKFAGHYIGEVMESPAAEVGSTPIHKNDDRQRLHIGSIHLDIKRVGDGAFEVSVNGRNVILEQHKRMGTDKMATAVDLDVDDTLSLSVPINLTVV